MGKLSGKPRTPFNQTSSMIYQSRSQTHTHCLSLSVILERYKTVIWWIFSPAQGSCKRTRERVSCVWMWERQREGARAFISISLSKQQQSTHATKVFCFLSFESPKLFRANKIVLARKQLLIMVGIRRHRRDFLTFCFTISVKRK